MGHESAIELLEKLRLGHTQAEIASFLGVSAKTISRWERGHAKCPPYLAAALATHVDFHQTAGPDFTFIDLFAGIGGNRLGFEAAGGRCIMTAEWDKFAIKTYQENFGVSEHHQFFGDVTKIDVREIPDHDVLLAGFPCQPFSIAGVSKKNSLGRPHGFEDLTQGTLFFDVARIISAKRPTAFMLENVKNLKSHDNGRTFEVIRRTLEDELGYYLFSEVINADRFVPQNRRRIIMVGLDGERFPEKPTFSFKRLITPAKGPTMASVLHPECGPENITDLYVDADTGKVNERYTLTPHLWTYLRDYAAKHRLAGNGFGYGLVGPEDIARTLSARYYKDGSEILVSRGPRRQPRRLTPRECARLMGFPDSFRIPVSDTQAYKQFGNSVVYPMVVEIAKLMAPFVSNERDRAVSMTG